MTSRYTIVLLIVLLALAASDGANAASSFLDVAPPAAGRTPSILALDPDNRALGPSMIAMGTPAPPVRDEQVSSVNPKEAEPILIRGGLSSVGNAAAATVVVAPAAPGDSAPTTTHYASKVAEKHALKKAARESRREANANPPPVDAAAPSPTDKPQ